MLPIAVDLQTLSLSEGSQSQAYPVAMRPKPRPQLYSMNAAARQVATEDDEMRISWESL